MATIRRQQPKLSFLHLVLVNAILLACFMFWFAVVHTTTSRHHTQQTSPDETLRKNGGSLISRESFQTTSSKISQPTLRFHHPLKGLQMGHDERNLPAGTVVHENHDQEYSTQRQPYQQRKRNNMDHTKSHPSRRWSAAHALDVGKDSPANEGVWNHSSTPKRNTYSSRTLPSHSQQIHVNRTHPCANYDALLHIKSGDKGAAAGTLFFQYVINQLIYADLHNLMPFIHLNNITHNVYDDDVHGTGEGLNLTITSELEVPWVNDTKHPERPSFPGKPGSRNNLKGEKKVWFRGTGVWTHYLEQVSEYDPQNSLCQKLPYVNLTYKHLNPGIQFSAPWAVRSWEYAFLPNYLMHNRSSPTGLRDWFAPQRLRAHEIVTKYYRFHAPLRQAAMELVPNGTRCLAVHIRHSDKAGLARTKIPHDAFLPFVDAYLQNGGGDKVYLATDSSNVVERVQKEWSHVTLVVQGGIVRSAVFKPVFRQGSHNRTNTEVLVDILAMSRCQYMIHGYSAVSESSHYLNPTLHNRSVDLEDPNHISPLQFGKLVKLGL